MGYSRGRRSSVLVLVLAAAVAAPSLADGPPQAELSDETTAAPTIPASETTVPPKRPDHSPKSPVSVVTAAVQELEDAFKHSTAQWLHATMAFVGGVLLVFFSERALDTVLMAVAAVIACNFGLAEVSKLWHSDIQHFASGPLRTVIGVEFGLLGALIAWKGKDAVMVVIAVVLGFTLSQHLEVFMKRAMGSVSHAHSVILYSIVTVVFILVVIPLQPLKRFLKCDKTRPQGPEKGLYLDLLIFACPVLGAPLVMSSIWYFVSRFAQGNPNDMSPWLEFLEQLLSGSARPVGVLAKYDGLKVMNHTIEYDRLVGYVGCLILIPLGILAQKGKICKCGRRASSEGDKKRPSVDVAGGELGKKLLEGPEASA